MVRVKSADRDVTFVIWYTAVVIVAAVGMVAWHLPS
jgi:hypothetical protein